MTTSRPPSGRRRRRPVAGRRPSGVRAGRDPGALTVQLLPGHLAADELPPAMVGDELEASPVIYADDHRPTPSNDDRWQIDEVGGLAVRGAILSPIVPVGPGDPVRPDVLEVAGRLHPVNWAASGVPTGNRIDLEGALYLDPEVHAGRGAGESVVLCRRWYRVQAIRRYQRTDAGPRAPVALHAVPEPADVSASAVYVADLVPLAEPALAGCWW